MIFTLAIALLKAQVSLQLGNVSSSDNGVSLSIIALLKAQVSLQLGNVSSSDNGVSLSIMYSYTYIAYG